VTQPHAVSSGHDSAAERRRHPRFQASNRLVGTLLAKNLPVRIRDVGAGGFSVETMEPVTMGSTERVRFIALDDWSAVLEARSLYCRPSVSPDGLPTFVTGFAFAESDDARRAIATILEKVTSVAFEAES
jgi:hypothetical protein